MVEGGRASLRRPAGQDEERGGTRRRITPGYLSWTERNGARWIEDAGPPHTDSQRSRPIRAPPPWKARSPRRQCRLTVSRSFAQALATAASRESVSMIGTPLAESKAKSWRPGWIWGAWGN